MMASTSTPTSQEGTPSSSTAAFTSHTELFLSSNASSTAAILPVPNTVTTPTTIPPSSDSFTSSEKRNIMFYILGIMLYKFVLETLNTCMSGLILNRLRGSDQGKLWTVAQSLALFTQCVGSLIVAPLVRRMYAGKLLATSVLLFGGVILLVPIIEGATGGVVPRVNTGGSKIASTWGKHFVYMDPNPCPLLLSPLRYIWGMVELMRRVIPAEIVGDNAIKLRRMDGIVHIFYEVSGTIGALFAPYWVSYFGWGYALTIMPIGYILAASSWIMITPSQIKMEVLQRQAEERKRNPRGLLADIKFVFYSFFHSIYVGGRLIFGQRALIWLIFAYSLALVHHRYLENTLFPFFASSQLGNSDYQSILTGGSNFGELTGAMLVVVFARQVKTPIPFLRLDAILILVVWVLPFITVDKSNAIQTAWKLAPMMAIISVGWAAGDISLSAYVQSRLSKLEFTDPYTSPLSAVMSFLYASYLIIYFILTNIMGVIRDTYVSQGKSMRELYIWIGGVFMTLCGVIVFSATFIPRGAVAWNPEPDDIVVEEVKGVGAVVERNGKEENGEMKDADLVAMVV
ncbi:hypothetical protein BC829DRAFT_373570 [Chytridium lagenaria]|nr:hypothetical protein BC829DRAFT_373570 [Chytridium lagenaria]